MAATSTSEDTWPIGMDGMTEWMERSLSSAAELFSIVFGESSGSTSHTEPTETLVEKTLCLLQSTVGALSFDRFQMQLLKIFLLVLMSTGILICAAWHIYGQRISERFMHSARDTRAASPCATK